MSMRRVSAGNMKIARSAFFGILLTASCAAPHNERAANEASAIDSAAYSTQSWQQLAEAVLERIDWSRVCDVNAPCENVLVDSVIRRSVAPQDPREATLVVSSFPLSRLPRASVRYVLGARGGQGPDLDAALTMVVAQESGSSVRPPTMEIVVRLLGPRWDDVHIWVRAARRGSGWAIDSLVYLPS